MSLRVLPTHHCISGQILAEMSGTRGDALRAIEVLPGVARTSLNNGDPILRGAGQDESQTYLNGAPVPFLYHFGGLTSSRLAKRRGLPESRPVRRALTLGSSHRESHEIGSIIMDLVERLSGFTQFGSLWVLWLLVGLSVLALTVALDRAVLFFSSRDDVLGLRREVRGLLSDGNVGLARRRLEHSPSFEARIAVAGLDSENAASAEERMRGEQQVVRLNMERNLALLGTLGNNAPFIGLLGTVIGIVRAFRELSHSKGQMSAALMAEIGEALVATAIGLLVALPAIALFNLFQRTIRARLSRADALSGEILAHLKSRAVE